MPLTTGDHLGPYEVLAAIGAGGMGEVYKARDTKLDRDVALKILPDAFVNDPERLARFQREAKVLASLNHPNIAAIYGLEDEGDSPALVLEYVPGPTLQDRIAKGPIPLDEALPIARQIAEALEAAHEQGIIHRDLKPANVKVKDDGTVKVLDFGLAKALGPDLSDTEAANSPTMTMTAAATKMGVIMGTAAYMAPEQARGKTVDKRADIWAFGVVLFEMLAGASTFPGDDVSQTLARVIDRDPDWDALPKNIPSSLNSYLRRCLQKDAKQRVRDIGDVRLAMEGAFDTAEPVIATAAGAVAPLALWQRPVTVAAMLLAAAVAAGLAVWTSARPDTAPADVMRFTITPPEEAPMSVALGPRDLTISPDGTLIVYDGVPPGRNLPRLHIRRLDGNDAVPVRGADVAMGPFVSPDGEWVGFISQESPTTLRKISVLGGQPLTVTESSNLILGTSWGFDDRIVFGTFDAGLFRVSAAGGEPELLTTLDAELGETSHSWPSIIPDRNAVLFVISTGSPLLTGQLAVLDLASGAVTRLGLAGIGPHYTPTGHLVYAAEDASVRAVAFDVDALEVTGSPVPLIENIVVKENGTADFSISDGGKLLYTLRTADLEVSRTLTWVDRQGGRESVSGLPENLYSSVALSPDGTDVAVNIYEVSGGGTTAIWTVDLERGTLNRLTNESGSTTNPLWTLDGRRIVYGGREGRIDGRSTEARARWGLFWRNADGTGDTEPLITMDEAASLSPWAWSPDGAWLLFQRRLGNQDDIGMLSMEGDRSVEWLFDSEFGESGPTISPDGNWIAYASSRSGPREVYVERFPELGDRHVVSTDGGGRPRWSPDGRELFYRGDGSMMAVTVDTDEGPGFSAGTPSVVSEGVIFLQRDNAAYDVAADGDRLLVISPNRGIADTLGDVFLSPPIHVVLNWFTELQARVPTGR